MILCQMDAKRSSDHELANEYRDGKENGEDFRAELAVKEAARRGISEKQLAEIR